MRTAFLLAAIVALSGCRSSSWRDGEDAVVSEELSDLAEAEGSVLPRELPELERLLDKTRGAPARAFLLARMNRIQGIEATRALARREAILSSIDGSSSVPGHRRSWRHHRDEIDERIGATRSLEFLPFVVARLDHGEATAFDALVHPLPSARRLAMAEELWPRLTATGRDRLYAAILATKSPDSTPWLVAHYDEAGDDNRYRFVSCLSETLDPEGAPVLRRALHDPRQHTRAAAKHALKAWKEQRELLDEAQTSSGPSPEEARAVEELMKLLESPTNDVVAGAARALGALRAKTALPRLVALLERKDVAISEAVHEAIARIDNP